MSHKLVVVESPAKAKTINKYLGSDYRVMASIGHVRDLVQKDGSVDPDADFAMRWEDTGRTIAELAKQFKAADEIYLATDPDREGEAIAWHIKELMQEKKALKDQTLHRITFNEITKNAVQTAIKQPRDLDQPLIDAYLARRCLDYLVGFSLSPVLWRKLPGAKSAGRVQSVALRLICEREAEIEKFLPQEYWSLEALFANEAGQVFPARLWAADGTKLDKFALGNQGSADAALERAKKLLWAIGAIDRKQVRRNPDAPFTTSTLQMAASRQLGMGATRTMRLAQQLYEGVDIGGETVGLITYMRTDGVTLSAEAIQGARVWVGKNFGNDYVPDAPRIYKSAAKNAQEAHEAIRPTDVMRTPDSVQKYLDADQARLYALVWQRTVASQMASAVLDVVSVDVVGGKNEMVFRASGSIVQFDGFLKLYREEEEDKGDDGDDNRRLPPLKTGEKAALNSLKNDQHFTQPPPRYTEATLVKKLEELGIGRPSTYASIMQTLQDRNYVVLDKRRFVPEDRGRLVTTFLEKYFGHYVTYDFTADLEGKLDDISGARANWKAVLRDFWNDFKQAIAGTADLKVSDVINALDEALGPHFFPETPEKPQPRQCTSCADGRLGLRLGKFGAFIGCSNYPTCKYTRPLVAGDDARASFGSDGPKLLGIDDATGLPITLRVGPYGPYVQLGPPEGDAAPVADEPVAAETTTEEKTAKGKKKKPKKAAPKKPAPAKRSSLLKGMDPATIDVALAQKLLSLPRDIGKHPEDSVPIQAGVGRFGPYIKHGARYVSLKGDDDVLSIGLNRAVVLLAEAPPKGAGQGFGRGGSPAAVLKDLGPHPDDQKPVTVHSGRYGPYVKHGKTMASLTKGLSPDTPTMDDAAALLAKKDNKKKKK